MKHLSLYVIATVNTAPTVPQKRRTPRAKKRFLRVPSFVRAFRTPGFESAPQS